jgi:tRNA (mo5U34)-methyltransferase
MNREELQQRVKSLRWWHIMDLGGGVVTPGIIDPIGGEHGPRFHVPARLDGKTVLDIGAWDGAWSFEAKRRGAARVLATDSFSWGGGGWGTKECFDLAREALELDVEDKWIDVLDLSAASVGQFDVVFFFGVIYHMRHPLLALERLRDVTAPGGLAIVESHVDMLKVSAPALAFYPTDECNKDATNWFGPNPAALSGMLSACGFPDVRIVSKPDRWNRMTLHAR